MRRDDVQYWVDNADRGIAEGKPAWVLSSSKNLKRLGKDDLAEKVLRDAHQVFADNLPVFRELCSTLRQKNPQEALEFAEGNIQEFGNHARFQQALALADLGRAPEAIRQIEEILQEEPQLKAEDRFVVSKLFDLYNDEGRFQEARQLLEPLIDDGVYTDLRMKQLLATVLNKLRQSQAKVLQLLENASDPQSEKLKQWAREIMGTIPEGGGEALRGQRVFLAYALAKQSLVLNLARYLERELGVETILMSEQSHRGRTLAEKFEDLAATCGFGIFVLTADDECVTRSTSGDEMRSKRPRQNVILELGYFWGRLGRKGQIAILCEEYAEIPSDIKALGWIRITSDLAETKLGLARELRDAGFGPSR